MNFISGLRTAACAGLLGLGLLAAPGASPVQAAGFVAAPPAMASDTAIQRAYWVRDRYGRRIWIRPRYHPPPRPYYYRHYYRPHYRPAPHYRRGWVDRYGRWHPY